MHSHSLRNYPSYFASFLSSQGCQSLFCCWPTRFALQVFLIGFWDNCSLPILSGRFANKAQLPFPSLHRLKKDFQGLPRLRGFGASAGDTWGWLAFLLWEGPCARPKQGFFLLKKKGGGSCLPPVLLHQPLNVLFSSSSHRLYKCCVPRKIMNLCVVFYCDLLSVYTVSGILKVIGFITLLWFW